MTPVNFTFAVLLSARALCYGPNFTDCSNFLSRQFRPLFQCSIVQFNPARHERNLFALVDVLMFTYDFFRNFKIGWRKKSSFLFFDIGVPPGPVFLRLVFELFFVAFSMRRGASAPLLFLEFAIGGDRLGACLENILFLVVLSTLLYHDYFFLLGQSCCGPKTK